MRANALVEIDGELIPVEHVPFESSAIPFDSNSRESRKQCMPNSFASRVRKDEEIFEEESSLSEERRVVVEEESEADFFSIGDRENHLSIRVIAKKSRSKFLLVGDAGVAETLVDGELANKVEHQGNVLFLCFSYFDFVVGHQSYSSDPCTQMNPWASIMSFG